MIIYNITLSIHPQIEKQALTWLKEVHIPEVMETKLFIDYSFFKVIENPVTKEHNSYAVQYKLESWDKFTEYSEKHADVLREKTKEMFGDNILAFRTFLEKV